MRSAIIGMLMIGALGIGTLLPLAPSRADIVDDIFGVVTDARDRATEARDRAIEARNNANALRDDMNDRLNMISAEIQDLAVETIDEVQRLILQQAQGRDQFVTDGGCSLAVCEPFRQDLVTFFNDLEATINTMYEVAGMPELRVDFERIVGIFQNAPGRALFPVYRALGGDNNLVTGGLLGRLAEARVRLTAVRDAMEHERLPMRNANSSGMGRLDAEVANCAYWVQGDIGTWDLTSTAIGSIGMAGQAFSALIQGVMMFDGTEAVSAGPPVANVKIESDPTDMPSAFFEALGESCFWAGNYVRNQAYYCSIMTTYGDVRDIIMDPKCEDGDPETPCEYVIENRPLVTAVRDDPVDGLAQILAQNQQIRQNQEQILLQVQLLKANCNSFDGDGDGDVDLQDFQQFNLAFTGPGGSPSQASKSSTLVQRQSSQAQLGVPRQGALEPLDDSPRVR